MALVRCEGCTPHPYQDKKYGEKIRVANERVKEGKPLGYRCTVCLKTHDKALVD